MKKILAQRNANAGASLIVGGQQAVSDAARPTTEAVAMNSQADVMAQQFQQSTYMAMNSCRGDQAVRTIALETRFLNTAENNAPQFSIENDGAGNKTVIIGSVLAMQGAYPFYNQSASACDSASMIDQFGPNLLALQGFSLLTNYNPIVVNNLQVISTNTNQVSQPFNYFDLSYDAKANSITMNVTKTFTRFDTNTTIMNNAGLWPVGPQSYLTFLSMNDVDLMLTIGIGSCASVRTFRQMN